MIWIAILVSALLLLLVWELYICEGAHLGRRFVVWLYDLSAGRYDRIKQFDFDWEERVLGEPLANTAAYWPEARFLDVGAGTGRVGRALRPQASFIGTLYNVEPSQRMLALGRQHTDPSRNCWVRAWAVPLPFAAECFDVVTCLEVLEFTPRPRATLRELRRVLRPGGLLLTTNRVGRQAPLIFGRTLPRQRVPQFFETLGLTEVEIVPWQVEYDLVWARKPLTESANPNQRGT